MTGEIEPGAITARHLTDRIKIAVETTWALIAEAYTTRAWSALGYTSWDDYCATEFGASRLRLPREDRSGVVASLRESGLSYRAIAAATGSNPETVRQDLAGVNLLTPVTAATPAEPEPEPVEPKPASRIVGMDGKTYPTPVRPVPPPVVNLSGDSTYQQLDFQTRLAKDILRVRNVLLTWDPKDLGALADPAQFDSLDELAKSVRTFADEARRHRPKTLRLLGGATT